MIRKLLGCRRSVIALTGITACAIIAMVNHIDTSGAIAMIVTAVAGANAAQATFTHKKDTNEPT